MEAVAPDGFSQHASTTSPSTPSSGDSARHNFPGIRGRMSSFSLDNILFCYSGHVRVVTLRISLIQWLKFSR